MMTHNKFLGIAAALALALGAAIQLGAVAVAPPRCTPSSPHGPTIGGVILIAGCR